MQAYAIEWLELIGRWVHLVTGIAWIGASFYFVWLDDHLRPPRDPADAARGVAGEVWSVHGGGFYHAQRYRVAPPFLPEPLHWFKWEAYSTWLSGVFLLGLVYWYRAEVYLVDPDVADLGRAAAVAIGAGTLAAGWLVYDALCRSPLGRDDRRLGVAVGVLAALAAWGLCQVFGGRGAFVHFGAMLGTIMVANVAMVIIPGQRELVAARREGREPDPAPGLRARQRSVHNTYLTLPVLFAMISNHYAGVWAHRYNWALLIALSAAGALTRLWFVRRHRGRASPVPLAAAAVLVVAVVVAAAPGGDAGGAAGAPDAARVAEVLARRCVPCHAERPTWPGFAAPPKGLTLERPADLPALAPLIHAQVVLSRAMPVGNLTGMTDAERELIDAWVRAGAPPP